MYREPYEHAIIDDIYNLSKDEIDKLIDNHICNKDCEINQIPGAKLEERKIFVRANLDAYSKLYLTIVNHLNTFRLDDATLYPDAEIHLDECITSNNSEIILNLSKNKKIKLKENDLYKLNYFKLVENKEELINSL